MGPPGVSASAAAIGEVDVSKINEGALKEDVVHLCSVRVVSA